MTNGSDDVKERNAAFWSAASARWAELELPTAEATSAITSRLNAPPGALILDAGCGAGAWCVALALVGYRVVGIDLAPGMLEQASRRAASMAAAPGTIGLARAEVGRVPFADSVFDGVICRSVLDFAPSPANALDEFKRVLKPGAALVVSTAGAASPIKSRLWRRFLPGAETPRVTNYLLPWELEALLGELGWEIVSGRPLFGASAFGAENCYGEADVERLDDRLWHQTIATSWEWTARKPHS